jgi:hypothetical protein
MFGILIVGFLLGVRHAIEADHVAAVAALATRSPSLASTVRLAAAWGIGHMSAILVCGSGLLLLDSSLPAGARTVLDAAVGVMLVALGADVIRRLSRGRVHAHVHAHGDGAPHVHFHAHAGESADDASLHRHGHPGRPWPWALVVGGMHGLAGTAGLTLLSLQAFRSSVLALAYLAVFGIGSVLGMVLFSIAIAVPLRLSSRSIRRSANGLEAALGVVTILVGGWAILGAIRPR